MKYSYKDLWEVTIPVNVVAEPGINPNGEDEINHIKFVDFPARLDIGHFVHPDDPKITVAMYLQDKLSEHLLAENLKQNRVERDFD